MKFQREVVGGEICYHYIRPWTFASTRSCFGIRLRVFFSSLKAPFLSSPVPKPASSPFLFLLTTAANHPRLMIMGAPSSRMISARMKSACARLSGCTEAFTHTYALALHIFSVPFVFSLTGRTWLDDGGKRVSFPNGRHLDKCNRENNISSSQPTLIRLRHCVTPLPTSFSGDGSGGVGFGSGAETRIPGATHLLPIFLVAVSSPGPRCLTSPCPQSIQALHELEETNQASAMIFHKLISYSLARKDSESKRQIKQLEGLYRRGPQKPRRE